MSKEKEMIKVIQTKTSEEELILIKKASKYLGISRSAFIRSICLKEARDVLKEKSMQLNEVLGNESR